MQPTKRKSKTTKESKRRSKGDSKPTLNENSEDASHKVDEMEVPTANRSSAAIRYSRIISQTGDVEELPVKEPEGIYRDPSKIYESGDLQIVAANNGDKVSDQKKSNQGQGSGFMKAAQSKALRPFVIISSSYLLYTITDGAIRMIVLQHAYNKSFSAMQVAIMFTLYELAGVFTNLVSKIEGKGHCIFMKKSSQCDFGKTKRLPVSWVRDGVSSLL